MTHKVDQSGASFSARESMADTPPDLLRRNTVRLFIGSCAAAVAFGVAFNAAPDNYSAAETTGIDATPTELIIPSPSALPELPERSVVTPESSPSPEIILTGVPERVAIPKLDISFELDVSNNSTNEPNSCGRYNNPCQGQGDMYINPYFGAGVAGVDKLSYITVHTSYGSEADVGAGLIDNPIDPYTHTGLELGDQIVFSGYTEDATVTAEVVPFPQLQVGQSIPNSSGLYVDKQEGLPLEQRTLTGELVSELHEIVSDDPYNYILLGNSYAGTGQNGFEMSPDDSGRKYSGLLLLRVVSSD